MNENDVKRIVQNELADYASKNQYGVSKIPIHAHTGLDTIKIDPANLLGFPITSTIPTDSPVNGTFRIYFSGSTYALYVRVNNLWKSVTLS